MFCLRSWIPILFFLIRTNASPVYLVLFISATYFLNRPCVYCSLLLFILVVALFDFHTPWFEQPLPSSATNVATNGTSMGETAAVFVQAANQTAQALVKAAVQGVKEKAAGAGGQAGAAGYEWAKGLVGKKEWRIPCMNVLVRL